ncbi:MAG TPA: Crp/Fnr family transcriptional regulator [Chthoniobacteraceae bacterium]|nr:Crp/Fnr family transcriptional regulator [Chthoniobacteraceae bacterium]
MKYKAAAAAGAIAQSRIFAGLSRTMREELAKETHLKRCARSEVLFHEGDSATCAWLLVNGLVKLAKLTPKGQELVIELAASDDLFGAVYYHEHPVYPATAIAIEPTTVACVSVRAIEVAMQHDPKFQRVLLEDTCRRLCRAQELRGLALEPVPQRLAWALSYLAEKFGERIPASRALLAQLAGTTVETAIRITGRWASEGWLKTERGAMTIIDARALAEQSGRSGCH